VKGIKHLVECHCVLPQYRGLDKPVYHKFITFSVVDDSDTVIPKYAQCNNCGVIHKIIDICKSEIVSGKEELKSITTVEELSLNIPINISDVLKVYNVDLPTWEYVNFIITNNQWGSHVILTKDDVKEEITGKKLLFIEPGKYKIEDFVYKTVIG